MLTERKAPLDAWGEEDEEKAGAEARDAFRPLSREEAQALRAQDPPLSPWRVVGAQAGVGVSVALGALLFTGRPEAGWSALYGAAVVVVPGALMARGMTSRLSSMSPGTSAVSVLLWASVKILVSIVMLVVANRVVQPLVWPALLISLVLCLKVYGVALLWRGRRRA